MPIDDRKQRILMAIVSLYADDGEPVGSNLLSKYFNMAVSSATLRNEMAALTKLGLLEQPHTSAGRVPTTKGYRYYVDNMLFSPAALTGGERSEIDAMFSDLDYDPEKLARGAAQALSNHLGYAVVITTPRAEDTFVAHFEVIQVGRYSAAVLAVTGTGSVLTRVAKAEAEMTLEDLHQVAGVLNENLRFVKEPDVGPALIRRMMDSISSKNVGWPLVSAALALLGEAGTPSVYFEGQHLLLKWQELEPSLRLILELMADREKLESLLHLKDARTVVILGDEMDEGPIPGLCVVARQYLAGSGLAGTLGVLGPTRIHFGEVIPKLEAFSNRLGCIMSGSNIA